MDNMLPWQRMLLYIAVAGKSALTSCMADASCLFFGFGCIFGVFVFLAPQNGGREAFKDALIPT